MISRLWATLLLASTLPLGATPAWKAELTPNALGSHPRIQPMALEYQMSWKGTVKAGKVTLTFAPREVVKPGMFVVTSQASSQGLAATLFPYKHHFWSELFADTLQPRLFHTIETDSKETATTQNRYQPERTISTEVTKNTKSGAVQTETVTFPAATHDLFSAMLQIRSKPLANGDKLALVTMPFKTPYLLRVEVLGREAHQGTNTIKLSISMRKIDRNTQELRPYKKLNRNATMWLSDDADRIPVELRADVFVGDVRAVLVDRRRL